MTKTVSELAGLIQGRVVGDGKTVIAGITNVERPLPGHIAFLEDPRRLGQMEATPLACLIVPPKIQSSKKPLIQVEQPKVAWARLLNLFFPPRMFSGTVSPQASIAPSACLAPGVTVEAFAFIGEGVEVGTGSVVRAYSYLDRGVKVGEKTVIHPHVMVYENTVIGNRCGLHAGSVIGADGFGYVATPEGR